MRLIDSNANQHNSNALNALEGDLISRDAIDEIKELMTDINGDTVYAVRMSDIRQLHSVTQKLGHCKDCKWRKDSDEVFRRGVSMENLCAACYIRSNRKRG